MTSVFFFLTNRFTYFYGDQTTNASMKKLLIILISLILSQLSYTQLTTDDNLTIEQIVEDYLVGTGVQVFNITYSGTDDARGIFNSQNANVGIDDGVMLATGPISNAIGPNNSSGQTGNIGGNGDPDLTTISGVNTNDAAILEFDFIPVTDTLTFDYVFASEEYMEFVGGGVNDAFGFFLSGPGINGTFSNNAINLAIIPGTSSYVSIDDVNANSNAAYYVDNGDGFTAPMNTDDSYIQYDGLTVVLQAVAAVTACDTFHIKIAIADGGDGSLDSGVFLKGGSFSAGPPVEITAVGSDVDDITVIEGCSDAIFTFVRPGSLINSYTVNFEISGDAENGVDFAEISDSVVFEVGEDTVQLIISPLIDDLDELLESLTISIPSDVAPCDTSAPEINEATVLFLDNTPLGLQTTDDFIACTDDSIQFVATASGGGGVISYVWSDNLGTDSLVNLTAAEDIQTYSVTVTDECNNDPVTEEIEVTIQCPIEESNIFTPGNQDGYNDYFTLLNLQQYPNSSIQIFDRWGVKIYESSSYQNDWDGRVNNSDRFANSGTYYYVVNASNGEVFHGYVTLIRE